MATKEKDTTGVQAPEGIDLHPRHASWVRISTHNNLISLVIFLALFVLFVLAINLHFSPVVLGALGVITALFLLWFVWRHPRQHRNGFLGSIELTVRIKADLMTELGANDVIVESSKGVVTLRGAVPFADFRESAELLARRQGAQQVINELKVVPSASARPDPYLHGLRGVTTPEGAPEVATHLSLEEMVWKALEDDPRVHVHVLIVKVADGIAYLTGRQETVQASDAATEVAIHVPGILGVSNDIEILTSV